MIETTGWIAFGLAAIIAAVNFYLSLLRYPIHRLSRIGQYRFASGIPAIGTLLLAVATPCLWQLNGFWLAVVLVAAVDTAGLPWFIIVMSWERIVGQRP